MQSKRASAGAEEDQKKYFFTGHIFDNDHVKEDAPPVFTEQQMEAARQKAYAEGRAQGAKEAEASQVRAAAQILDKIQKQLEVLTKAEAQREAVFEQEALRLALAVIEKIFPLYSARFGLDDLKHAIEGVMRQREGLGEVAIIVAPDAAAAVEDHLKRLKDSGLDLKFILRSDSDLGVAACRLAWTDGGAMYDFQRLADEIFRTLEQVLAKTQPKVHDGEGGRPPEGE